ncbi:MAG: dUTP diphosphatase [Porticoccaceae bacterium]|jgi:dUTP pyrophosphatase
MTIVKIQKVDPNSDIETPKYMTSGSVGFDIRAAHDAYIWPNDTVRIGTGLRFEIPEFLEMQIRPRSGISSLGVQAFLGTVDSDYRGEVCVMLYNGSPERFQVCKGDRIAQGVISPITRVIFSLADHLSETARGEGGFGHTGVK